MSPLLLLLIICHITYTVTGTVRRDVPMGPPGVVKPNSVDSNRAKVGEIVDISSKTKSNNAQEIPEDVPNKIVTTVPPNTNSTNTTSDHAKKFKVTEMESGALIRGILVVVALSVVVIIYMALKTYYGNRNKPVMVRKYGVRTRRSDIEMTPLPLEEDEDDETLFEVSTTNR